MTPEYLTVPQLAALFGVSPTWVYQQMKRWPHSRFGTQIRFDEKDVEAIRELQRKRPPETAPVRRTGIRGQKRR